MRTIAIVNQKGGCGKTTTAINLSAFLARETRRVLLIDMDPQGHATLGVMTEASRLEKTVYEVLAREEGVMALRDIIVKVQENLDLAPADVLLSALPEKIRETPGKENRLSEALDEIRQDYDYVIVDCPPNVGLLTFNALKACSEAIIPVDPGFFSLHGIAKQIETLDLLSRTSGHDISVRALITLYVGRSDFGRAIAAEIRTHLGGACFNTVIRFSVKLPEAAGHGLPVADFSTRSAGFADYKALAREVLDQESVKRGSPVQEVAEDVSSLEAGSPLDPELAVELRMEASPPVCVDGGVLFTIDAPGARCVQLAGDFNGWVAEGNEMRPSGPIWSKVVPLTPGRYHYRYVVDGRWLTDPLNINVEPTPWGGYNSVVDLEGNNLRDTA
jgi:chromosome partitioning protein